jgi:acetoin utilization deacetylase AcuC-like enzyme
VPTLLLTHPAYLDHRTPTGHPERPDRIRAVETALADPRFDGLLREEAPLGTVEQVLRAHPQSYVERILASVPDDGLTRLDADTVLSPGSRDAVMRAVGASCRAVDAVLAGAAANAFSAHRPPGHHAERETPMGFCIFNHAAVAARHAQAVHGIGRVAIVDFDVHHGNGTQDIFWSDPSVLYASTHESPLYPGTGAASEAGVGNIVNAPLPGGSGGEEFRAAMEGRILPALRAFKPDLVILSAGFDAHHRDPLASLRFVEEDFFWVTRALMEVADETCGGRVVSLLEGGYDLRGLAASAAAHVAALMG